MKDDYLSYYILSYFDLEKVVTLSQILHVFHAKRTPSMFYLIESNNWHHGFSLTHQMTRKQLAKRIQNLLNKKVLINKEKGYLLTNKGREICEKYFSQHYYPQKIKRFTYTNVRAPFWNSYQLFTQAFSEFSYQNNKYIPIVKHPSHQENVRQLFQQFHLNKKQLLQYWSKEQEFIFKQMDDHFAEALANQLTGHEFIGKTRAQLSQSYEMTALEFDFYFKDGLEETLQIIHTNKKELPLNNEILNILHQKTYYGLSASTYETYRLLKKGWNLSEIAKQKEIKENTVKEHILEIAFVFESFPYKAFIPSKIYERLHQGFKEEDNFTYQKALEELKQLEFMHYRLVELERMRLN